MSNVVNFNKIKHQKSKKFMRDLTDTVQNAFVNQNVIEKKVKQATKQILLASKGQSPRYRIPAITHDYIKDTYILELWSFHLYDVLNNDVSESIRYVLDNLVDGEFIDRVVSIINEDIDKTRMLIRLANKAPARQYALQTIDYQTHRLDSILEIFLEYKKFRRV